MLPPDFLQEIDPKTKKRNLPLKTVKYIVEKYYDKSKQTKDIVNDFGFISFTKSFKYLGSWISYDFDDRYNIESRIKITNQVMGAISFCLISPQVDIRAKFHIHLTILINLLL